tara:strand:- start:648 stop:950 length:303 start_codon:yes stop_codon:yes gene_type:complete
MQEETKHIDTYNQDNWGTMKECGKHFGISRQRVHQLLLQGRLGQCEKAFSPIVSGSQVWMIPKPFELKASYWVKGHTRNVDGKVIVIDPYIKESEYKDSE